MSFISGFLENIYKKLFLCSLEKINPKYEQVENFHTIRYSPSIGFCVYHINDLDEDKKQQIENYLTSYYYTEVKSDFFDICFDSILKIMIYTSWIILGLSWFGYFFSIAPLLIFTLDILVIWGGYELRKKLLKTTFTSELEVKNVIYTYNGEKIDYKKNIPVVKDKSILLTGFLLILLTFSFYTVSIMGSSLAHKSSNNMQNIQVSNNKDKKYDQYNV